ncbi:MAG: ATP-binding protein, partial [Bacteroidota bacterium]
MARYQKYLVYAILIYMVLAFGWWTVLLTTQTREVFDAKVERLETLRAIQQRKDKLTDDASYLALEQQYKSDQRQIIGEALLLAVTIFGGAYLVFISVRQEVSATKQQRNFLLSITHELKSPIAGIRLILETFQKRRDLPEAIREKLSTNALKETDRLTSLVNDLLLSAKLETSYQLNPEPIDLEELLQETVEKIARKYPKAQIQFTAESDLPFIRGDRTGLTSVAVNLVENAAKYSQPTPKIDVHLRRGSHREVIWTVADNGIGIPDAEKGRVLTKFYRVGN